MGVERVDYYSDEEYRQAKMMEEQERREQEEIQMAEEMVFEQLLMEGEYRQLKKDYKELLNTIKYIKSNWWDKHYPESVFDGSSNDEGPKEIVKIRNMINNAIDKAEEGGRK